MPSKKRKRCLDTETTLSGHLSLISSQRSNTNIPTPTLSTSSQLSDPGFPVMPAEPPLNNLEIHQHEPRHNPHKRFHFTSSPSIPQTPSIGSWPFQAPSPPLTGSQAEACHICHRRPKTMQDVSGYTNCQSCRLRTCNICIRTCAGPRCRSSLQSQSQLQAQVRPQQMSRHQSHHTYFSNTSHHDQRPSSPLQPQGKNVCRACCIEVGVEGRVWCEPCYNDDTEAESFVIGKGKKEIAQESVGRITDWLDRCGAGENVQEVGETVEL